MEGVGTQNKQKNKQNPETRPAKLYKSNISKDMKG